MQIDLVNADSFFVMPLIPNESISILYIYSFKLI